MAPPLYRQYPLWYNRGLTQIASRFSTTFSAAQPPNFHLLPSFAHQELLPDGVFLTPVSGLHYVLYLFDQTESILASATMGGGEQFGHVKEQVRHHEDRMTFLESKHGQLQTKVDLKTAADAEFNDWVLNRSEEDWFVIRGLPRLSSKLNRSEWQDAARRQVADVIKQILKANKTNLDFMVMLVANPLRYQTTSATLYNVKLDSVYASRQVRDLFSGFFRKNRPVACPPALRGLELRNKVTLETKIRIAILRQLGSVYEAANDGSSFKVCGYEPRPKIAITPARGASDKPRTLNFIQDLLLFNAEISVIKMAVTS